MRVCVMCCDGIIRYRVCCALRSPASLIFASPVEDIKHRIFLVSIDIISSWLIDIELTPCIEDRGKISFYGNLTVQDIFDSIIAISTEWKLNSAFQRAHTLKGLSCVVRNGNTINLCILILISFG